jgi:hypothetical protein
MNATPIHRSFSQREESQKRSECPIDELEDPNPVENILHQQPK